MIKEPVPRSSVTPRLVEQQFPFELKGHKNVGIGAKGHYCSVEPSFKRLSRGPGSDKAPPDRDPGRASLGRIAEATLSECRILVVEDDFLLAADLGRALRDAGATVLGPVGQEDQALALVATEAPTCALLDINLGQGMQFSVADALRAAGIPFVFVTGYDDVMIPERFRDIGRMRKPMGVRLAVGAAAQMCRSQA